MQNIKQTLSTKPYRHQQHLPKISENVSELYGGQFDMEEIPALFDVRAFKQLH